MADLQKHIDQIKAMYSYSPSHVDLIDQIWMGARRLDEAMANSPLTEPVEADIVEVLWKAHGSPTGETLPEIDPVEAKEAHAAPHQGRRHK